MIINWEYPALGNEILTARQVNDVVITAEGALYIYLLDRSFNFIKLLGFAIQEYKYSVGKYH
jgi:hypothetical protein